MSVSTKHLKFAGALGSAALVVGAVAAPAMAAPHNLTYNCSTGSPAPLGPIASTLEPGAIPATMTAGQVIKRTMSVTVNLDAGQTAIAQSLGTSVKGSITGKGVLALNLAIPTTPIPPPPATSATVTASGPGTITASKAGTLTVNAGTIAATLNLTGGLAPITATETCTAPTDGTQTLGTVAVAKDKSKSVTSASYNAKKDKATATAKVKGATFGLAGTGKVKFTLKKGTKTVKSVKATLNKKGVATAAFTKVKKPGKYSVSSSFAGDAGLKASSGKAKFTVK